jgi:HD-like signal output (HDOD) protein
LASLFRGIEMSKSLRLDDLLASAQLPALPQSAIRLLELSRDLENGPPEYAQPIEADPGLAGQVLRFVNSSYFGFAREIANVRQAITLVGVRTIKNFALWSAVFSLMPNPRCGPFDLKGLFQDSLRRALFARSFGKLLGLRDAEDLFAAALLQDMAIPLLAKELPEQYVRLITDRAGGARRLSDLEQEEFGWNHAQAAGMMARLWNLPEEFAALVESHLEWRRWLACAAKEPGKAAVSLSALLPSAVDDNWCDREAFEQAFEQLRGPQGPTLEQFFSKVDEGFSEFAPVLKLANPSKNLVHVLREGALATV